MEIPGLENILSGGGGGLLGVAVTFFLMKSQLDDVKKWKEHQETEPTGYTAKLNLIEIRLGNGEKDFKQLSDAIDEIKDDMKEIRGDLKTLLTRRRDDRKDE